MARHTASRQPEVECLLPSDPKIEPLWKRLQAAGGVRSPFLSWRWFSTLADSPAVSCRVRVLVVTFEGGPMGLLPVEFA